MSEFHLTCLAWLIAGAGLAADGLRRAAGLRASNARHGLVARHYRYDAEALLHDLQDERWLLESISPTALLRLVA